MTGRVTEWICLLLTISVCKANFVEDVYKDGASGTQVVGHVVDLIGRLCLLDNELFLRRMAFVETRDGTTSQTYRTGYNGGIWNIDEGMFNATKDKPKLVGVYDVIKKNLHIDWNNVTWGDLRKPLISGLATTMFLVSRNYKNIPESPEIQASIWGTLRPQNAPNTFFFDALNLKTDCQTDKALDIVVVLDFANITTIEVVRVQSFLETLLKGFHLELNATRVGLVTKTIRPIGGWYLNSQRPGFTIITALKALKYVPGPTVTGDSLKLARETMFTAANGMRQGAAKVVLLLTDGIKQFNYAKDEVNKLQDQGISTVVVEINHGGNATSRQLLEQLVDPPRCRNARVVDGFPKMSSVIEEIELSLCNSTLTLTDGDYEFPCQSPVSAKLPGSSSSVTVQVTTTSGTANVFASKSYSTPDEIANDVHFKADTTGEHTLFVRGTDPMFVKVAGQNCTGNYTVHVQSGQGSKGGKNGTCVIAGTVRECTASEMDIALHDIVLVADKDFPNLCDSANSSIEYYPHPREPKSFIMCDRHDIQYVGLCPVNQSSCVQFTSGCKYANPCTQESMVSGATYHNDPCGDPAMYLQCTQFGVAVANKCLRARVWNQDTTNCVFKYLHDPKLGIDDTTVDNPCIHSHEDHVYFPYPKEISKYILCDVVGNAFVASCPGGGVWNQQTKSCSLISRPVAVG